MINDCTKNFYNRTLYKKLFPRQFEPKSQISISVSKSNKNFECKKTINYIYSAIFIVFIKHNNYIVILKLIRRKFKEKSIKES